MFSNTRPFILLFVSADFFKGLEIAGDSLRTDKAVITETSTALMQFISYHLNINSSDAI
jgi:hypothetical protein